MWRLEKIPGFAAAYESERQDRALAFLGLPENIAGVECAPLTQRRVEWLRAYSNPFICGGTVSNAVILQFLWIVNPRFRTGAKYLDGFIAENAGLDVEKAREEIDEYLDRAFLDSHAWTPALSYFSPAASLIIEMGKEPFKWDSDRTLDCPLSVLYQLIKARDKEAGCIVVNKRSDKVSGDWLDEVNERMKVGAAWRKCSAPSLDISIQMMGGLTCG